MPAPDRRRPLFARCYARASQRMDDEGLGALRTELLAELSGDVVEIGCGNGRNFARYPAAVTSVTAVEPEPHLRALAVLTSEALIGPVKAAYDRPRPPGSLIETSAAAFPSGHAIAAAVTAVGLVLVLAHPGPSRWRWEVRAVVFTGVMALSRVYLRAHWLSDTVAGALLGAGLALGWPALLMVLRERWPTGRAEEGRARGST